MKRIVLALVAFCLSQVTYSQQNTFPATGNVGIGTITPNNKLDVTGDIGLTGVLRTNASGYIYSYGRLGFANAGWILFNNGTAANMLFAETASNVYSFSNSAAVIPLSMNMNTGNVGIGTINPISKLFISDGSNYQTSTGLSLGSLTIANNYNGLGSNIALFENQNSAANNQIAFFTPAQHVSGIQAQRYDNGGASSLAINSLGGNVGIGTINPLSKLNVNITSGSATGTTPKGFSISDISVTGGVLDMGIDASSTFYSWLQSRHYNSVGYFNLVLNPAGGNVGIGITNPNYKLTVEGTIGAREVKVTAEAWSDFVFHPTYKLRTLGEVEQFIKANNHLPEIPTESEVKQNGVGLGEMNAKLLQKIEELTLYMIEQNKKIERVEEQNNLLMKEVEQLKAK